VSRRISPLPAHLAGGAFSTAAAIELGVGRKRIDHPTLHRPFAGVRAIDAPTDVLALCHGYLPKMAAEEFFSHVTSAVLHGMWLPLERERDLLLDVAVRKPCRAPRDRRVRGHHLVDRPHLVRVRHGLRTSNALETWCQLATVLDERDLVIAGDSLLAKGRPRTQVLLERMVAAAADEARPCSRRLGRAARRIRCGSRSPWETRLRLLVIDAGLPEPEINALVPLGPGAGSAEVDLVYRDERVLLEYEGDQHRTDLRQWRRDIRKYERLTDCGWRVIRVTADDVVLRPEETIARIRAALARG